MPDGIDESAAAFAERHGSFTLHFDSAQNHLSSDYAPWSLMIDGDSRSWGSYTADAVIKFADSELCE